MNPALTTDRAALFTGNALGLVDLLGSNAVDAVVTDPPYELGFMGKKWDASGIAFNPELWRGVLEVLKPGAFLLAFGGTRTYHRMTCAIEDAGFEIRDSLHWFYGTGFPKSLDVAKGLDRLDATAERRRRDLSFTEWLRSTGITSAQINEETDSNMGGHYLTAGEQPCVPTEEMFSLLRPLLGSVPAWVETLVAERTVESETFKRREVVGERTTGLGTGRGATSFIQDNEENRKITAPASVLGKRWAGWGTALKPGHEPIVLAMKPLDGTFAQNIEAHGVGALNIDGSRLEGKRWPSNVLLDEQAANDLGGPASFFYVAKPGRAERDLGCAHLTPKTAGEMTDRGEGSDGLNSPRAGAGRTGGARNHHPTVKPVELLRYLCRLITPPGGLVLDPFTGSGSTGVAALAEGFEFLGVELSDEYAAIAKARLEHALNTRKEAA